MAQKTSISWTDLTVNPIRARDGKGHTGHYCEKVSAGCANCYSSRLQSRFLMPSFPEQRKKDSGIEVYLDEKVLLSLLKIRKPQRVFPFDMTDLFGEWVPDEWLDKFFAVVALTPHLTYQVLTKRIEQALEYFTNPWFSQNIHEAIKRIMGYDNPKRPAFNKCDLPLKNLWLGTSVENQKTADERIPTLLQIPAAVYWISGEPLLGPVNILKYIGHEYENESGLPYMGEGEDAGPCRHCGVLTSGLHATALAHRLDWCVVGGESGPQARPFDIQWARDIIRQCKVANVPVFVKQLGANPIERLPGTDFVSGAPDSFSIPLALTGKGDDSAEWPEDLRVQEFPEVTA